LESEVGAVAEFMTRGLVGGKDHADSVNEANTTYFPYKAGEDPNFYLNAKSYGESSVDTARNVRSRNRREDEIPSVEDEKHHRVSRIN